MMQITGKSASFRGLTLLLALMLGAGLALTGCGDDDSSTTTPAPAPTPAPQPPAPEPPGTPANLRVADTGVDYIEFAWDAVEGATGYEVQMSMTEGDFGQAMMATVTGTMHKFMVAAETTAYGRVRATNDDGASDWSEPAMGMSMAAPMVLGVPVPEVSSTGPDHIEWSWEAIMNAQGYQVQVADSMDGLADAEMMATTETSHRVDAEPEMTMYIRVRSAVLLPSPMASEWSMAVEGMSDVMPMPFVVSMTPPEAGADRACSGQAFCPDSMTDVKKAMAGPNKMMMVSSSHQAQVSPEYIDDAAAVDLNVGDNTPFQFVSWDAMQSLVAGDGVTFMLQRISTAAGQEPMPMGDKMYITCGPFECSDAMDEIPAAPDITIANSQACTDFDAELTLNVGLGFNGGFGNGGDGITLRGSQVPGSQTELKRGIDAGWTYTSTSDASVMHEFVGVLGSGGGNLKVMGAAISKTSVPKPLMMGRNKTVNQFGGTGDDRADEAGGGPIWNGDEDCFGLEAPTEADAVNAGYSYGTIGVGATRGVAGTLQRPQECFRIVTAGRASVAETSSQLNYLDGYRVHVTPNASVSWGSVNWPKDEDPFDGLDCEGVSFDAADFVDVCGSFQEQAMGYWGNGVGNKASFRFKFAYIVTEDTNQTVDDDASAAAVAVNKVLRKIEIIPRRGPTDGFSVGNGSAASTGTVGTGPLRAPNSVWSSLWLVNADKTATAAFSEAIGRDSTVADGDLYFPNTGQGAYHRGYKTDGTDRDTFSDSFTNTGSTRAWRPLISMELIDSDGDPLYRDFGKVDFHTSGATRGKADNFASTNSDAYSCSSADNGSVVDDEGGNGACDAEVTFDESFTLSLYQDSNECTQTIDVSFTCTWDADGDDDRTGDASGGTASSFGTANVGNFVTCTMN